MIWKHKLSLRDALSGGTLEETHAALLLSVILYLNSGSNSSSTTGTAGDSSEDSNSKAEYHEHGAASLLSVCNSVSSSSKTAAVKCTNITDVSAHIIEQMMSCERSHTTLMLTLMESSRQQVKADIHSLMSKSPEVYRSSSKKGCAQLLELVK